MMKSKQKKIKNQQQIILRKSADQELVQNRRNRKKGYIEVFFGALILLTGIWLYSQTWGLKLLSVDVWIGRISRYYGIFWLLAGVCFILGFWKLMHTPEPIGNNPVLQTVKEASVQNPKQTEQTADSIYCPQCGKINDSANNFCAYCGSRLREAVNEAAENE